MKCQECKKTLTPIQVRLGNKFCSRNCFGHRYSINKRGNNTLEKIAAVFWSRVDKGATSSCWQWQGATRGWSHPYGVFQRRGLNQRYAHRIAFELINGDIPAGRVIRHSCDNPKCCNPAHLLIGTLADNNKDKHNRMRHRFGSKHQGAKLTEKQAQEIRKIGKSLPARVVAQRFGVHERTIYAVRWRRTWTHI